MGIHSGPVSGVVDVNERTNVAGAGINTAQRVMDCGDAGHILLSRHVAEDLAEYERWRPFLHDIGTFDVRHGVRVSVTNLYSEEIGNAKLPTKLQAVRKRRAHVRWAEIGAALLVLGAIIAAFVFLLHRSTRAPLAVLDKSIAVLPFDNRSEDKANAYFTDGVQDEILTHLAKIADLKVISRTSVLQYKSGVARNLREIAQQLGVANVVEGSVQRSGNRVRVNAQLVDARNDAHLWAQTYDRDLDDVFAIQSEIAKAIADQLQAKLSPAEKNAIEERPTSDLIAFDQYSRAKTLILTTSLNPSDKNLLQAIELLNGAVARDPSFHAAFCQLVFAHHQLYSFSDDHTPASLTAADAALQRILEITPDDIAVASSIAFVDLDWRADTAPLHQFIDRLRSERLSGMGDTADIGFLCALAERDWAAAERALTALGNNPFWGDLVTLRRQFGEGLLAHAMHDEGRAQKAFAAARLEQEQIVQQQKDYGPPVCVLGLIDAALGNKEAALQEGRRAMELLPVEKDSIDGQSVRAYFAVIAAWAGEKDLALQQLATAAPTYGAAIATSYGMLKLFPFWDSLRGDPRFEQIVASFAPKQPSK